MLLFKEQTGVITTISIILTYFTSLNHNGLLGYLSSHNAAEL